MLASFHCPCLTVIFLFYIMKGRRINSILGRFANTCKENNIPGTGDYNRHFRIPMINYFQTLTMQPRPKTKAPTLWIIYKISKVSALLRFPFFFFLMPACSTQVKATSFSFIPKRIDRTQSQVNWLIFEAEWIIIKHYKVKSKLVSNKS